MAICAKGVQQADGSIVLVLDPLAPDLSACQYVVQSGAELANSLFSHTAEEGWQMSAGIIACWAAAYTIRSIMKIIKDSSE